MNVEQANQTASRQDWEDKRQRHLIGLQRKLETILRNSRKDKVCKLKDYIAVPTKKGSCKVCKKILLVARSPLGETSKHVELGPLNAVLSSPCKAHNRLIIALLKHEDYPDIRQCPITRLSVFKLAGNHGISISGDISRNVAPAYAWGIRPLAVTNLDEMGTARVVYNHKIQMGLLRRWKDRCDRCHGITCRTFSLPSSLIQSRPQWLIDTWTQSLVPGTQISDYVALSYVWGPIAFFTTKQENLRSLQTPGAFSLVSLPKTIRDTLMFVEKFGERYCWIDALCIVQDDRKAKYAEIENMSAIYANASFTIIAEGTSDSYSGLPGISTPRNFDQAIFQLGRGFQLASQRHGLVRGNSTWITRAWTFQEHLFSKRRMIFDTESVRWECSNEHWFEDIRLLDTPTDYWSGADAGQKMLSSNFPDSTRLAYLLASYNTRNLTYEQDVLDAFTGVMKVLCHSFKHGFLSGLPLLFFDIALLWQPRGEVVRRIPANVTACLPSWSWVGWKCDIDTWSWAEWNNYRKSDRYSTYSEAVIPSVQWSYCQVLTGMRVPITSEWYQNRENYLDSDASPPTGWTKHNIHEGSWEVTSWPDMNVNPQQVPRCFYKHDSDPTVEFWYPIPLPDTSAISNPINASFISCHTRRAWLFGGHHSRPFHLALTTAAGDNIGYVQIFQNVNCAQNKHLQLENPLEVVEIAKGCRTSFRGNDSKNPRYDYLNYYHVMWIEWKGNIAYRKGLGRVSEEAWSAECHDFIELTLG